MYRRGDILGKIQVADSGSDQMGIWEAQTPRMLWNPAAENNRSSSACVCTTNHFTKQSPSPVLYKPQSLVYSIMEHVIGSRLSLHILSNMLRHALSKIDFTSVF